MVPIYWKILYPTQVDRDLLVFASVSNQKKRVNVIIKALEKIKTKNVRKIKDEKNVKFISIELIN